MESGPRPAVHIKSFDGMLKGIEFARRRDWPFLGTCGAFSTRSSNAPAMCWASRMRTQPRTIPAPKTSLFTRWPAPFPAVRKTRPNSPARFPKSACGQDRTFNLSIRKDTATEEFFCNFEVNPDYEWAAMEAGFPVVARGTKGEIRAIESPTHRFYIATLFQPQLSSKTGKPHPLVLAFVQAAADWGRKKLDDSVLE